MVKAYAISSYVLFQGVLIYFVGWLADVVVPKGISDGSSVSTWSTATVDVALLGVFAAQHSVMARPGVKRIMRRLVPPPAERATYVLFSSLAVALLMWQWRPLNTQIWNVGPSVPRAVLWFGYAAGWVLVVASTYMIDHFDLFGLRQAVTAERYVEPGFGTPGLYAHLRHPIMTGFAIAFWATPDMTAGHLLFAAASTVYIVIGVRFEERDLRNRLGDTYVDYAAQVPRFIPLSVLARPLHKHSGKEDL